MLDYVEFLRTRGQPEVPAPGPDASASWPGTRFAPERNLRDRDAGRPSSLDDFLQPPPRRHAAPIALGVALLLAVLAIGGFLYYRYVWSAPGPSDDAASSLAATPDAPAAVVAARAGTPAQDPPRDVALADAGIAEPPTLAVPPLRLTLGGEPDAAPLPPQDGPPPTPDAGPAPAEPDAETVPPSAATPTPAAGAACSAVLDEARALWRKRQQDAALQKLREAIACDPSDLEPRLQWGRWFVDSAASPRYRDAVTEGAELLRPAAEANPAHGELWFHYTNLLFGSRQREAAQAAREHCIAIRPSDEYSASCRFLPQ